MCIHVCVLILIVCDSLQAVGQLEGERAEAWQDWLRRYRAKLRAEGVSDSERRALQDAANAAYIPRNQLMQRAIEAAEGGDYKPVSCVSVSVCVCVGVGVCSRGGGLHRCEAEVMVCIGVRQK